MRKLQVEVKLTPDQLRELPQKAADAVFTDFALRERERLRPISLKGLFTKLRRQHLQVRREDVDNLFDHLQKLGFGALTKLETGETLFKPAVSIPRLGQAYFMAKGRPVPRVHLADIQAKAVTQTTVLLFTVNGQRCRAEVPNDVLPQFERMVKVS